MGKGHGKGSSFERKICKKLSMWWSKGKRDDIFWRSSNSGGRATQRSKSGRKTFGQYGDIQATDPIGQPLIDVCSLELKKGYFKHTIADMLDAPPNAATQVYENFIIQASGDSKRAGSQYWMLITQRDRRLAMVYVPIKFYKRLTNQVYITSKTRVSMTDIKTTVRIKFKRKTIFGCRLDEFLKIVKPSVIKRICNDKSR